MNVSCSLLVCHQSSNFSAYEVKNNWCLFERLFNVKKNGVFLFRYFFFVLEIFMFLYYANEEGDDVIGGSTKTAQHLVENNSRNIKAVFFKLGTSNVHHNRNIMTPIVPLP